MHSSGMHTARLLTVSQHALDRGCVYPSMHWAGGVYPSMHWAGVCVWQTPSQADTPWAETPSP